MTTDIATQNNSGVSIVDGYSTIKPTDAAEAARLYGAVSSAKPLKDMVNVPIAVADILVQNGTAVTDGGEVEDRLIVTLIDENGNAFGSNSPTVATDLQNLIRIMGEPGTGFWGQSLTVVPKLVASGNGRSFLSLSLPDTKK